MTANLSIRLGALFAALAVLAGAFAAHGLKEVLDSQALGIFRTAAQYQFYHALALILTGIISNQYKRPLALPGWFFVAGILLFSGSLYLLALTSIHWIGAITPLGGLSFVIGWLILFWQSR